ncbi:unnamed protein product [marine sediment metagenome]|uniref:Uncharacterized protein n=1 Tax=marine sediment metagenome TaxID=412755 RepID=X1F207_9ZZZZ
MKLVALLVCVSLIGVVSADIASRYLIVDLTVTDASYSVNWVSAEPVTLSVLETYTGELVFATILPPTANYAFDVIFEIVTMPAGASFSDVQFGLQVGSDPVIADWMTGLTATFGRIIPSGLTSINHDMILYVGYPGVWQFQLYMDVP